MNALKEPQKCHLGLPGKGLANVFLLYFIRIQDPRLLLSWHCTCLCQLYFILLHGYWWITEIPLGPRGFHQYAYDKQSIITWPPTIFLRIRIEYTHVFLPKDIAKKIPKRLVSEQECGDIIYVGIQNHIYYFIIQEKSVKKHIRGDILLRAGGINISRILLAVMWYPLCRCKGRLSKQINSRFRRELVNLLDHLQIRHLTMKALSFAVNFEAG